MKRDDAIKSTDRSQDFREATHERQYSQSQFAQHARLRNEAVRLKDDGLDYIQIGHELDVTTIAARDLCMLFLLMELRVRLVLLGAYLNIRSCETPEALLERKRVGASR